MCIAKVELSLVATTTDSEVVVEGVASTSKHLVLPVVSGSVGIEVGILVVTKQVGELFLVVAQLGIFPLVVDVVRST